MTQSLSDSRLANLAAKAILEACDSFYIQFDEITSRAKSRFEERDWAGMREDAAERLDRQERMVSKIVAEMHTLLGNRVGNKLVWVSIKAVYSGLIANRDNWELAETFFNSMARRIFPQHAGVDPQIEFVDTDFEVPPSESDQLVYRTYSRTGSIPVLLKKILNNCQFSIPFENLDRDADLATLHIRQHLRHIGALQVIERAEIIRPAFYRGGRAAYLIGRAFSGSHIFPLVLSLRHYESGIVIDAVLLEEDAVSILFSFTHSYFHVEAHRPYDLIRFLRQLMPRKRMAELYISLGYNKHGKTEMYRDLLHHIAYSNDRFEIARGIRGMVMLAFTLPGYDVIIKIIKDRFDPPKKTNHQAVKDKYHLVFMHDRAGRLIDAQRFARLRFNRQRFQPDLLEELLEVAGKTVEVDGDSVIIHHAYLERRVIPLNIYVDEADEAAAEAAVIDYGHAIKDLAVTNIFPGDLLLKNFGVTRHGRVIFYDYDELCLLTDCRFRRIPPARNDIDEMSAEPWFRVEEGDIFPEQFPSFLGLRDDLRAVFIDYHADLFGPPYWREVQHRLKAGTVPLIYPYEERHRLHQK